jgi:hypothetical protein
MLGVGAGDPADRAELADAVRGADRADAANTGISVSAIGGVEFVATADPVDIGVRNDGVFDGEGEIAWHAEDVGDTKVVESAQDVFDDGRRGGHEIILQHHNQAPGQPAPALSASTHASTFVRCGACQMRRSHGCEGSTQVWSTGPIPVTAMTAGSVASGRAPS